MKNRQAAIAAVLISIVLPLCALNWPSGTPVFLRSFGQDRGPSFSGGLVFGEKEPVRAADYGKIVVELQEPENMTGFPSTLGRAVVLLHDEGLMTVYGNMESTEIARNKDQIEKGSIIGTSGNSAWQETPAGLEFHTADIEKKTLINPLVLLPQLEDTEPPVIRNVTAVQPNGNSFVLGQTRSLPHGSYHLYGTVTDTVNASRTRTIAPFRTNVVVNGTEVYSTPYEVLRQSGGQLTLSGTRPADHDTMYPSADTVLLAAVELSRGRAFITVTASDFNGNQRTASFTVDVL